MTNQNDIEAIMISHKQGIITADQANVEIVRMEKVRVVSKLHASVRSALNSAVKNGELRHKKKDGLKPEVYYHPDFEHLANDERSQIEREAIIAIAKVHI